LAYDIRKDGSSRQAMRFYILSQSQLVIAVALPAMAVMAVVGLAIYACRVFGGTVQHAAVDDPELTCHYCKSKAIHESFRSGIMDHIFWLFSCTPYRCYICSCRFYLHRPHSAGRPASQLH
jgi:hypothetical protein